MMNDEQNIIKELREDRIKEETEENTTNLDEIQDQTDNVKLIAKEQFTRNTNENQQEINAESSKKMKIKDEQRSIAEEGIIKNGYEVVKIVTNFSLKK
jgi:hypothetical protein